MAGVWLTPCVRQSLANWLQVERLCFETALNSVVRGVRFGEEMKNANGAFLELAIAKHASEFFFGVRNRWEDVVRKKLSIFDTTWNRIVLRIQA
jgi:hypothetical protein